MEHNSYVVVIDDDSAIRDLISELLTEEGYIVLSASTVADVLPTIAALLPALCLVDVRLPGMSGLDIIEHLRMRGLTQIPVVVMTASTQDAKLARAAGLACLDKPFELDQLLACVARYVFPHQVSIV